VASVYAGPGAETTGGSIEAEAEPRVMSGRYIEYVVRARRGVRLLEIAASRYFRGVVVGARYLYPRDRGVRHLGHGAAITLGLVTQAAVRGVIRFN